MNWIISWVKTNLALFYPIGRRLSVGCIQELLHYFELVFGFLSRRLRYSFELVEELRHSPTIPQEPALKFPLKIFSRRFANLYSCFKDSSLFIIKIVNLWTLIRHLLTFEVLDKDRVVCLPLYRLYLKKVSVIYYVFWGSQAYNWTFYRDPGHLDDRIQIMIRLPFFRLARPFLWHICIFASSQVMIYLNLAFWAYTGFIFVMCCKKPCFFDIRFLLNFTFSAALAFDQLVIFLSNLSIRWRLRLDQWWLSSELI